MRIDKKTQKKCIAVLKELAIKNGYKKIQDSIYKIEEETLVYIDFLIVNSERLLYTINIKKLSFDILFWKIMKMEDNIGRRDSLRVTGAFVSPTVLIAKDAVELSEDVESIASNLLKRINKEILDFPEKSDLNQYILSDKEMFDKSILQCLSYLDLNRVSEARQLAKTQILLGDTGRFENEGKGFFELLLLCDLK